MMLKISEPTYFFYFLIIGAISLVDCNHSSKPAQVETVNGMIPAANMGRTLIHEHLLVDFIGADSIVENRWDDGEVIKVVLPYLIDLKESGCKTLIDCTPNYLGRDVKLLKELSIASGIQILTNTGFYGAYENKYVPAFAENMNARELAGIWIGEFENGIDKTNIKPGFIKISVDQGGLSDFHQTIIRAAGLTHLKTGLTIASHTGEYPAAKEQLDILEKMNISGTAFIWVHAQAEKDLQRHIELAKKGVWISLDGVNKENASEYVLMINNLKDHLLLTNVLLSHDAGWYSPGEVGGGNFKPFTFIWKEFIPMLEENGFTKEEVEQIVVKNPEKAFAIGVKLLNAM